MSEPYNWDGLTEIDGSEPTPRFVEAYLRPVRCAICSKAGGFMVMGGYRRRRRRIAMVSVHEACAIKARYWFVWKVTKTTRTVVSRSVGQAIGMMLGGEVG